MRLIDAEVAEKMLRAYADEVGCHRGEYELANGILKAVCYFENIPTAYDVEKVVEKLKYNIISQIGKDEVTRIPLDKAIEIVKGGGVDGN